MGDRRARGAGQRTRTVREDWSAWIPREMDELFDAARQEMESSNFILSIIIDEALHLCKGGDFDSAKDRAIIFAGLFDRLAARVNFVIQAIKDHGSHFGTLPNVKPLSADNFRGATAQKVSLTNSLLARVVFRQRTRFFHKLQSLGEIIDSLQDEARSVIAGMNEDGLDFPEESWQLLEVLSYDLTTCMGETTIILKSFFCALPPEELDPFREKLLNAGASPFRASSGRSRSFGSLR